MASVIEAARGAAEAVARPGHKLGDLHEASMEARRGIRILKHEPDVAAHREHSRETWRAAFGARGI